MADAGWVATSLVTLGPTMPAADDSCCGGLINMQRSRVPESELERGEQANQIGRQQSLLAEANQALTDLHAHLR